MVRSETFAVLVALLALAGACDDPLPEKTPRKRALESITSYVFLPMLEDVRNRARDLEGAAESFCESPRMTRLDAARQRWSAACEAWKRTDVLAFGPHSMSPYRFAADIDFWPVREDTIDEVLGGGSASSDEDAGAGPSAGPGELPETLTVSQKGLPAIEYLLFGPGDATLAAFQDPELGEHRCAYLRAMTEALVEDTTELERVFREEFAPDFTLAKNPNDRYDSVNDAFGELVNNMIFAIETVRGTRLAGPLGLTAGGVPQPDEVESRYSGESIPAAIAVLEGVSDVFFARPPNAVEGGAYYGIDSVLKARNVDLGSRYRTLHESAVSALLQIPEPLSEAVVDDPDSVQAARDAITDLLMLLQVDVAQALSVTATFGRNDGDGD